MSPLPAEMNHTGACIMDLRLFRYLMGAKAASPSKRAPTAKELDGRIVVYIVNSGDNSGLQQFCSYCADLHYRNHCLLCIWMNPGLRTQKLPYHCLETLLGVCAEIAEVRDLLYWLCRSRAAVPKDILLLLFRWMVRIWLR
jgi:hypothetical protein